MQYYHTLTSAIFVDKMSLSKSNMYLWCRLADNSLQMRKGVSSRMNKKVFQILVENSSGVLSRISGLFSRRGYNIESITAGETAEPGITRITIVASGDDEILEQIEKQVAKLVDVLDIRELEAGNSVFRELALIKVKVAANDRQGILSMADIFRANVIDVAKDALTIELTGSLDKIEAFLKLLEGYEILELARTGIAGLCRGTEGVVYIKAE